MSPPLSAILLHIRAGREAVREGDRGVLQADPEPDTTRHNPARGKAAKFRRDSRRVRGGPRQVWQTMHPGFGVRKVLLHDGGDWEEPARFDAFLLP